MSRKFAHVRNMTWWPGQLPSINTQQWNRATSRTKQHKKTWMTDDGMPKRKNANNGQWFLTSLSPALFARQSPSTFIFCSLEVPLGSKNKACNWLGRVGMNQRNKHFWHLNRAGIIMAADEFDEVGGHQACASGFVHGIDPALLPQFGISGAKVSSNFVTCFETQIWKSFKTQFGLFCPCRTTVQLFCRQRTGRMTSLTWTTCRLSWTGISFPMAWRFEFASLFVHHVSTHRWRVLKVENADPITWGEAFVLGVRFTLVVSLEGCLRLRWATRWMKSGNDLTWVWIWMNRNFLKSRKKCWYHRADFWQPQLLLHSSWGAPCPAVSIGPSVTTAGYCATATPAKSRRRSRRNWKNWNSEMRQLGTGLWVKRCWWCFWRPFFCLKKWGIFVIALGGSQKSEINT